MVLLREPTSHGPHVWFVSYLFINNECWLDFFGDQRKWELIPPDRLLNSFGVKL